MKYILTKISFISGLTIILTSCNVMKRVGEDEHLLTKSTVVVNDKNNNTEIISNLISQKPNSKLLGFPLRLHIYNLARPNIDSVINAKIDENPKRRERLIKKLSKKQLDRYIESRKKLNDWLKKTGERPRILDELKTQKSATQLRQHFFSKGWFETKATFDISKKDNQKAVTTYNVTTGKPYLLDSITHSIATPKIDTLYQKIKQESLLKTGEQFDESNFNNERRRLTASIRNSGFYHFGLDYITYEVDTSGVNKTVNTKVIIQNRTIKAQDSNYQQPFKAYKIKNVNIITDYLFENRNEPITDSTAYNGYNLYSYNELKYKPKTLTDAIFISKDSLFKDIDRTRTYRFLNELKVFKYPNIEYIESENDTTLTANIYLTPKKKYGLGFDFDVTQSNIQAIGFSFSTGIVIRNIFKGAEILEVSALGTIGASKDASDSKDQFFDINEVGGNLKLTIPRFFFPFNTDKIIPKHMSPSTRISLSATSQRNIGLDKQTLTGSFNYRWKPSQIVTNSLDLFNIKFIKNLNTANYFGVYQNSFDRLNTIAQTINYVPPNTSLTIPSGAEVFITDVLNENTILTPQDQNYIDVNNIDQRKRRLTENNLIFSSKFNYIKDKRDNIFDNDFSIFRVRLEFAGNLLSNISSLLGLKKNSNDRYEIFNVDFSQYAKTEIDYVKYFDLGKKNVFALRSYFGIAIPYGNSNNIPFSESFFAGGPNDNRAWTAYNLGPGSSETTNEFNEANLKLHFSIEERFNIFGNLNGALFVDAGNIWNVFDDIEDENATFNNFNSLENIAIGSGFGLRYDFRFFIMRGDMGFKTYDPSFETGNRWFKEYNFKNAVFNIGINYPF